MRLGRQSPISCDLTPKSAYNQCTWPTLSSPCPSLFLTVMTPGPAPPLMAQLSPSASRPTNEGEAAPAGTVVSAARPATAASAALRTSLEWCTVSSASRRQTPSREPSTALNLEGGGGRVQASLDSQGSSPATRSCAGNSPPPFYAPALMAGLTDRPSLPHSHTFITSPHGWPAAPCTCRPAVRSPRPPVGRRRRRPPAGSRASGRPRSTLSHAPGLRLGGDGRHTGGRGGMISNWMHQCLGKRGAEKGAG